MEQGSMKSKEENRVNNDERVTDITGDSMGNETEDKTGDERNTAGTKSADPSEHSVDDKKKNTGSRDKHIEDKVEHTETKDKHVEEKAEHTEAKDKHVEEKMEHTEAKNKNTEDKDEHTVKDKAEHKENEVKHAIEDKNRHIEETEDTASETAPQKSGKKKRILIPIGIIFALIVLCGCIYSVIAYSYKDKFLPGTWVNGIDCAELDAAQVVGMLENQLQTYHLDVMGRDHASGAPGSLLGQVSAAEISLVYSENSREMVNALLAEQNIFAWLYRKLSDDTYSFQLSQGVTYNAEQLKSAVTGWEACQPDHMTASQNAYISEYSEELKGYEIIPEVEGTKFSVQTLLELMDVAILSQETVLDLDAAGCYTEPAVRQDAVELTAPVETANKWLGSKITYDWNGKEVIVDAECLKDWITMEKDGPVLDEGAVAAFVKEQAEENDTYGKRRNFVTTLGVELSLRSGYYGWLTDQEAETEELIDAIYQGKTLSREPVYASTARQKGMSDIGDSYVEVDLTHQHLYLYEDGAIIFESDFVSGSMSSTPDCVTPEGVFGLSYKTTNAVLRGATYETPVNYWMPFYGNYGLHDATWRGAFGGQIYITNGSHGCVNLPLSSAATIYEHVSTGFPVICYYYQVDPLAVQPPAEEEGSSEDNYDDSDNDNNDGE